jgi:carboxypeptidase C (cathepsin A)
VLDLALFALLGDLARSSEKLFPKILATKLPVLLYNGNYDLICNYFGTRDWTNAMDWPYRQAWSVAKNQTWSVAGQFAGYYRAASTLTQLVVDGAGHMVFSLSLSLSLSFTYSHSHSLFIGIRF